jgi:catechol 2,3-dioxygenase-like lactoylglutathione lyase family enzyme
MARIRHIALVALESEKVAEFYKTAFGMEEVHRHKSAETGERFAIYLSDGYINLAILPLTSRPEGIYHFGFQVDDVDAAFDTAMGAGAAPPYKTLPRDGRFAEKFVVDPVGVKVDLSRGWATSPAKEAEAAGTAGS